jgi:hypothetical protein
MSAEKEEVIVALRQRAGAKRVGITHFPFEEEALNQQRLPPRGKAKQKRTQTRPRKTRMALVDNRPTGSRTERKISSKSAKGGKSNGSRAALLSRRQSSRGRKARKSHPLDLL